VAVLSVISMFTYTEDEVSQDDSLQVIAQSPVSARSLRLVNLSIASEAGQILVTAGFIVHPLLLPTCFPRFLSHTGIIRMVSKDPMTVLDLPQHSVTENVLLLLYYSGVLFAKLFSRLASYGSPLFCIYH